MKTAKTQKASVIRSNAEQAERFVNSIEANYLPALTTVLKTIEGMGIAPTKELVCSAISGNFEPIETAYREVLKADAALFQSPAGKASVESMFIGNINNLKEEVAELFSGIVGNTIFDTDLITFEEITGSRDKSGTVSMNSPSLFPLFDVNENGEASITDEIKESILEAFREYATQEQEVVYQAQQEAAKAITKLTEALKEAEVFIDLSSGITAGIFFHRFFTVHQSESGKFTVKPKIEGIK